MSQGCIEICAPNRDYSYFEIRKDLNLERMPYFPYDEFIEDMPFAVRSKVVAAYMQQMVKAIKKIVEQTGVMLDEPESFGTFTNRIRSSRISETIQGPGLRDDSPQGNSGDQGKRAEDSSEREGPNRMDPASEG
jgi:hypothetical protein